jgi:hypothetical protein
VSGHPLPHPRATGLSLLLLLEDQLVEVTRLREIATKYEFIAVSENLRATTFSQLSDIAPVFAENSIQVQITHETWASPATRKFANQLSILLSDAGFKVQGPEFATVYLVGPAFPLEWGFNQKQAGLATRLYHALASVIKPSQKHAQRNSFEEGQMRIHFGGQVVFDANGSVMVE